MSRILLATGLAALLAGLLAAGGCASERPAGGPGRAWVAADPDDAEPVKVVTEAGRLRSDVLRAFSAMHWAALRVEGGEVEVTAVERAPEGMGWTAESDAGPGTVTVLRAWALLPDGRTAAVHAGRAEPPIWIGQPRQQRQAMSMRVRIGRFGDPQLEAAFLEELRNILEGDPARQRVRFALPETR